MGLPANINNKILTDISNSASIDISLLPIFLEASFSTSFLNKEPQQFFNLSL